MTNTGLNFVVAAPPTVAGTVSVTGTTATGNQYTIDALSKSGKHFLIVKDTNGVSTRHVGTAAGAAW
jgi:hypothetical protein